MDEAAFSEYAKNLVQQGAVASDEKYVTENLPTDLYLHFLPFLQGMLYVGNDAPLHEGALQLLQNLADAFSTAYARYEDFRQLEDAKNQIEKTFTDLKAAQSQLIQAEKMASLGELTAGIAHEIQNPLNFVNNFSELSNELIDEVEEERAKNPESRDENLVSEVLSDIKQNLEKINHHGKRAADIVKGMLQHSRTSSGQKESTDINALSDEYLRLAYHGLRAKDKSFNADFKTDFDPNLPKINVIPQDIGRVLLNLINNAFYAVDKKAKDFPPLPPPTGGEFKNNQIEYRPTVTIHTASSKSPSGDLGVEIRVIDNGSGIPFEIKDK
jgi:signal transduction histidine kinase